jgi:hypothetical protein
VSVFVSQKRVQWLCFSYQGTSLTTIVDSIPSSSTTGPVSISVGVPFVPVTWLAASSRSMCSGCEIVIGVVAGLATSWTATFGTFDVGT